MLKVVLFLYTIIRRVQYTELFICFSPDIVCILYYISPNPLLSKFHIWIIPYNSKGSREDSRSTVDCRSSGIIL